MNNIYRLVKIQLMERDKSRITNETQIISTKKLTKIPTHFQQKTYQLPVACDVLSRSGLALELLLAGVTIAKQILADELPVAFGTMMPTLVLHTTSANLA